MTGKKLLYEAGAKKVYNGDSEDQLIVTFTDQLLSNHGSNTGKIKGKASMSNTIFYNAIALQGIRATHALGGFFAGE